MECSSIGWTFLVVSDLLLLGIVTALVAVLIPVVCHAAGSWRKSN